MHGKITFYYCQCNILCIKNRYLRFVGATHQCNILCVKMVNILKDFIVGVILYARQGNILCVKMDINFIFQYTYCWCNIICTSV